GIRDWSVTGVQTCALPIYLVGRDFSAPAPNVKWCGDFKQIDTDDGPLYLGSVEDFYSRRLLGFAMSEHYPDAELAKAAIHMAVEIGRASCREEGWSEVMVG